MSQIVRCDVCGGVYNKRYLRAHQRLSHRITQTSVAKSEPEALEVIVYLYAQLSDENKKVLRDRLATSMASA
jgi:hypothetical protein